MAFTQLHKWWSNGPNVKWEETARPGGAFQELPNVAKNQPEMVPAWPKKRRQKWQWWGMAEDHQLDNSQGGNTNVDPNKRDIKIAKKFAKKAGNIKMEIQCYAFWSVQEGFDNRRCPGKFAHKLIFKTSMITSYKITIFFKRSNFEHLRLPGFQGEGCDPHTLLDGEGPDYPLPSAKGGPDQA